MTPLSQTGSTLEAKRENAQRHEVCSFKAENRRPWHRDEKSQFCELWGGNREFASRALLKFQMISLI